MSRGSSDNSGGRGSGGGQETINPGYGGGGGGDDGGGQGAGQLIVMKEQGQLDRSGRYVLTKTYLREDPSLLAQVPETPPGWLPTNITWRNLGAGVYAQDVTYESYRAGRVT